MQITFASPSSPPPFVNRVRELATLRAELAAALAGQGRLVLLSGEAGIGKTALAAMLCREAADAGAHVLAGHCYDRTESPPYGPWLEFARRVRALPAPANAPPIPRLDTATSQADLFAQARDFLTALTAQRPLLLLLEDLHWTDSASLDLLRFIAHGIGDMPLLLVATYRGEEVDRRHPLSSLVPLLVREAPTERLALRPLDAAAAQALVRARHDLAESAAHRLATYLMERTEGNALFMTELLAQPRGGASLDRLEERSYTEVLAQVPVPLLLKQIVDDRLARLGDETAALLAIAAVIGQEVPLAVWEAVTPADEETLLDRGGAGGGGASRDGFDTGRRDPLHPRADPRCALRERPRAAPTAAAPAGGGGARRAPRAGPGRGGVPLPAGGGRARGGVAGAGGRARRGCLRAS